MLECGRGLSWLGIDVFDAFASLKEKRDKKTFKVNIKSTHGGMV